MMMMVIMVMVVHMATATAQTIFTISRTMATAIASGYRMLWGQVIRSTEPTTISTVVMKHLDLPGAEGKPPVLGVAPGGHIGDCPKAVGEDRSLL